MTTVPALSLAESILIGTGFNEIEKYTAVGSFSPQGLFFGGEKR